MAAVRRGVFDSIFGRWMALAPEGIVPELNAGPTQMAQLYCIWPRVKTSDPQIGVDEHPFITYFEVHQGIRVWSRDHSFLCLVGVMIG